MKLNLTVSGKVLDSVNVHPSQINDEYYLKAFRRLLILRHSQKVSAQPQNLSFFVEQEATKGKKYQ